MEHAPALTEGAPPPQAEATAYRPCYDKVNSPSPANESVTYCRYAELKHIFR